MYTYHRVKLARLCIFHRWLMLLICKMHATSYNEYDQLAKTGRFTIKIWTNCTSLRCSCFIHWKYAQVLNSRFNFLHKYSQLVAENELSSHLWHNASKWHFINILTRISTKNSSRFSIVLKLVHQHDETLLLHCDHRLRILLPPTDLGFLRKHQDHKCQARFCCRGNILEWCPVFNAAMPSISRRRRVSWPVKKQR